MAGTGTKPEPVIATANIDLTGTPFALSDDFCHGGADATMVAPLMSSDENAAGLSSTTRSQIEGDCAWTAPSKPACPATSPFNASNGVLELEYVHPRVR
jgi:hypothetical protein